MKVPSSYRRIKIKDLPKITEILSDTELNALEKDHELISYLSGKSIEYIEKMPFWKLDFFRRRISFLHNSNEKFCFRSIIIVNGRLYRALEDVSKFSTNRYLSFKTYVQNNDIPKALSMVYKPLFKAHALDDNGNYGDLKDQKLLQMQNDFSDVNVSKIYGAVFFYANAWRILSLNLQAFLIFHQEEMTKISEDLQDLQLSKSNTDGTTQ